MGVLRTKISSAQVLRKVALEGYRFTPQEALASGIVDLAAGENTAGVLAAAQALAAKVGPLAKTGAWGINKVRRPFSYYRIQAASVRHRATNAVGRVLR